MLFMLEWLSSSAGNMQAHHKSLHLTFDSLLGLATPSPRIDSNAGELRRWASVQPNHAGLEKVR